MGSGIYATSHFTACVECGQLCRVEVCMPVVTLSDKRMVKFCPMCGAEWHYQAPYANSAGFKLVARALFGREPTDEEVIIIENVYGEWDATVFPVFRDFLKSLIAAGV